MKALLTALKGFAVSIGGLIVVIFAVFWHADILNIIENIGTFNLVTFGVYLGIMILMFAVIWAQSKSNALLSHGILFFLFASSLSGFLGDLFSNNPSDAFNGNQIVNVLIMLYTLGVVVAYLLYDRPKPAKVNELITLPMIIFFAAYYVVFGFSSTLLVFLIVLVAFLLGSGTVGIAYAMYAITSSIFLRLNIIFTSFSNNLDQSVNVWFTTMLLIAAFVFLIMSLVKKIQANEA